VAGEFQGLKDILKGSMLLQFAEKIYSLNKQQIPHPYPPSPFPPERGKTRGLASLRPALGLRPKPHLHYYL